MQSSHPPQTDHRFDSKVKAYFTELQTNLPDSRDKRGKRHNISFVLTSFLMAILRSMSQVAIASLRRWMVKQHAQMVLDTGYPSQRCISDTQLRRVLSSLDYELFNHLNGAAPREQYFGASILEVTGGWQAVDGKELRGNIDGVSGEKRGENLVRMVDQEDSQSSVIGLYHGAKASEKTVVKDYFSAQRTLSGCYSFDAPPYWKSLMENRASIWGK